MFINSRMLEGAKAYSAADRSDPFAFRRAMTHLRTGVASFANEAFYSAEHYEEKRALPDGREYTVTGYRNRTRP